MSNLSSFLDKICLNPKHLKHPSALGHSEAKPKNLVGGNATF